jgi:hypothetical protein
LPLPIKLGALLRSVAARNKAPALSGEPAARPQNTQYDSNRASVNASALLLAQARDFVLQLQLAAFEFRDHQPVRGRMHQSLGNFIFQRLVALL